MNWGMMTMLTTTSSAQFPINDASKLRSGPGFWIVLAVAFGLRLGAAFTWQSLAEQSGNTFRFGDSHTYWQLGERIAAGQSYEYGGPDSRVFRAPGYPLFLAAFTNFEKSLGVLLARIGGAILGTLGVAIVMLATNELAGRSAAILSGILASIYPGAIGMSIFILSEAVFVPWILLSLWCWTKGLWLIGSKASLRSTLESSLENAGPSTQSPFVNVFWVSISGASCGMACLARPSWLLWPVCMLFCVPVLLRLPVRFEDREIRKLQAKAFPLGFFIFGLAMIVVMLPWWFRNFRVTGHFVPTTLQVGASLYDGLHEGATGASDEGMAFSLPFEYELRGLNPDGTPKVTGLPDQANASVLTDSLPSDNFEWRLNRRLWRAAWDWAIKNRSDVAHLALIKFVKTWSPWPTAPEVGGVWIRLAEATLYVGILVLAGIGLATYAGPRPALVLYALPTFYFAALHLIFVGSVRYRQPAIVVLCVVAGIGATWMLEQFNLRRRQPTTRR
jgi:hypothetical protein